MALTEQVILDISRAQSQINQLERQLDVLEHPINIPVNVTGEQAADSLRRELNQADNAVESLNTELRQTDDNLDRVGTSARRAGGQIDDVGRRGTTSLSRLTASAVGLVGALAAFQGFQALGRGLAGAISDASDLEESLSKATVVFGDFTDSIETIASDAPRALGLSTGAALEATATFGNLFVALGLTQQAAADMAPDIVQLAADLASFNNISVDDAILSLRSGLVGEAEPLRRLGVSINAAVVDAKALELGLVDASGAVTEAGKVQARYALILEQTTTAQGDYARTADGIANTQRSLKAEFQNVSAALGEALLPAYAKLLDLAPSVLSALESLTPVIAAAAESMANAAPSADAFATGLQAVSAVPVALGTLQGTFQGIFDVLVGGARALTDTEAGLEQVEAGIGRIQDAALAFDLSQLRNELVNQLQAGIDPAQALATVLVGLTDLDLDSQGLKDAATSFATIAGLDTTRLSDLSIFLLQSGAAAGFTADEVQDLREALVALQDSDFTRRAPGGSADAARQRQEIADATLDEATALDVLGIAADTAGVSIAALLADQAELEPTVAAAAAALSDSTLQYLNQVEAINELDVATGALAGTIEAAADAMRTAEGEIVTDFGVFLEQLRTSVAEQQEFDLGLALLRALGLDDLAAQFETAGVEALALVNDALANPENAREAERLLDGQYLGVGSTITDDIREGLSGETISSALVQELIDAAAQANTPEVRAALLALAEEYSKLLTVTPTIVWPDDIRPPPASGSSSSNRGTVGPGGEAGGVTVIQNFNTDNVNSTETERAAAEINSIVAFVPR